MRSIILNHSRLSMFILHIARRAAHKLRTYSLGFWVISARRLFAGPIKQIAGASALCPFSLDLVTNGRLAQRKRWAT